MTTKLTDNQKAVLSALSFMNLQSAHEIVASPTVLAGAADGKTVELQEKDESVMPPNTHSAIEPDAIEVGPNAALDPSQDTDYIPHELLDGDAGKGLVNHVDTLNASTATVAGASTTNSFGETQHTAVGTSVGEALVDPMATAPAVEETVIEPTLPVEDQSPEFIDPAYPGAEQIEHLAEDPWATEELMETPELTYEDLPLLVATLGKQLTAADATDEEEFGQQLTNLDAHIWLKLERVLHTFHVDTPSDEELAAKGGDLEVHINKPVSLTALLAALGLVGIKFVTAKPQQILRYGLDTVMQAQLITGSSLWITSNKRGFVTYITLAPKGQSVSKSDVVA